MRSCVYIVHTLENLDFRSSKSTDCPHDVLLEVVPIDSGVVQVDFDEIWLSHEVVIAVTCPRTCRPAAGAVFAHRSQMQDRSVGRHRLIDVRRRIRKRMPCLFTWLRQYGEHLPDDGQTVGNQPQCLHLQEVGFSI